MSTGKATSKSSPEAAAGTPPADGGKADATTPNLGIALSGGGVRAALFSLGVIIGLVETSKHLQVSCIASVSGGSIVNAVLAHMPGLRGYSTVEEFEPVASKLSANLAWTGVFAFSFRSIGSAIWLVLRLVTRAIIPVTLGVAFLADQLRERGSLDVRKIPWSEVPWGWVVCIAVASLSLAMIFSRGLFQEAKYRSILREATGRGTSLYLRDWGAQDEESKQGTGVMHVLVATDLLSGEPMYFSKQFIYCRPYGWSPPRALETHEALYSSAAFPGVFPPKRLRRRSWWRGQLLHFQNGEMAGELPRTLYLADGGIYNNLGYDWFDVMARERDLPQPIWPFGQLEIGEPPQVDQYIVVNAGAPSRAVKGLGILPIARTMSVLYDNTVRPRVDSIREARQPLIDIDESPAAFARRLGREMDGEAAERAQALSEKLETKRSGRFWQDFSRETAGTKTKLTPAGRRTGARLMLHGYLSCLVLIHVLFGAELPESLRGEEYFLRLVDGGRDSDGQQDEPAQAQG